MKAVKLRYCLVFRFELVAALTIRSLYSSDNYVVFIELEISGALFAPVVTTHTHTHIYIYVYIYYCQVTHVVSAQYRW